MPRRKGDANIIADIRGSLRRAIKIMDESGRPLSTIWQEMFKEDPFQAMRLAIQAMPKEMDITTTTLSPEQWLEIIADGAGQRESDQSADSAEGQLH